MIVDNFSVGLFNAFCVKSRKSHVQGLGRKFTRIGSKRKTQSLHVFVGPRARLSTQPAPIAFR